VAGIVLEILMVHECADFTVFMLSTPIGKPRIAAQLFVIGTISKRTARAAGARDQDCLVSKFHGTPSLSDQCSIATVAAAMPFNSARVSGVRVTWPAARFSRRWTTDDVPGINRTLRERCSSHASAT
jgi:hypothetical protein